MTIKYAPCMWIIIIIIIIIALMTQMMMLMIRINLTGDVNEDGSSETQN